MEVMRVVLLCALALLPQGLGNDQRDFTPSRRKLLNTYDETYPHLSDVIGLFRNPECRMCTQCMSKAIRLHNAQSRSVIRRIDSEELHNEIVSNSINRRFKKEINFNETNEEIKKKLKNKKNKLHKTVTVTKYNNIDGKVTALKVKEINTVTVGEPRNINTPAATCDIYSIKKSFACDSPEGELMMKFGKRTSKKKGKKESKIETTTGKIVYAYRKRDATDNSQIPESVMSSVEEFY